MLFVHVCLLQILMIGKTVALVHGHIFNEIKPVSTLVEVSRLIDKELLIEIEVSAVVQN